MSAKTPAPILFDFLSDGIVVVSRKAEVRYVNAVARSLGGWEVGASLGPAPLREALDRLVGGSAAPPVAFELALPRDKKARVTLIESARGGDVFVSLAPIAPAPVEDVRLANFMTLLKAELGPALQTAVVGTEDASALGRRLAQLGALAEAHLEAPIVASDRIDLQALAEDAMAAVAAHAGRLGVRIAMSGFDKHLPPVYGSRRWLLRAFIECLQHAIEHGARGACVELRAAQHGTFVRITLVDHGYNVPPFLRAALAQTREAKRRAEAAPLLPNVGLAVCERVLELHGGHIRIESDDAGRADLLLELPTGAPAHSPNSSGIEQAWRYAEDLARLMAERQAARPAQPAAGP